MTRTALLVTACTVLTGWTVRAETPEPVPPPDPFVEHAHHIENNLAGPPAAAVNHAYYYVDAAHPATATVVPVGVQETTPGASGAGAPVTPAPVACCECGGKGCPRCCGHFQGDRGHLLHKKCTDCAATTGCASCAGDCGCHEHKSCIGKLCAWIGYCPHTPKCACPGCHNCTACCCGPLYQYFLCTVYPTQHVGDGYYIGQYPSTTDRPILNAAYGPGFIEQPPNAFAPQYQRYEP
jgi:hypothetical protein